MTKQRLVFLDIDGPIINTPMFYLGHDCSVRRTWLNTQAIAYVNRLCAHTKALVVTNSTHNNHDIEDELTATKRTLKNDLVIWGLKEEYFHTNWKTNYPNAFGNRLRSITDWISDNSEGNDIEYDWVCFDDSYFTNDKRLVLIDYDRGIDYTAYRKAMKLFGYRHEPNGGLILV
jgi:hypothetical protein